MDSFLETQPHIVMLANEKIKNHYQILSEIGRGGMGIVYKAVQIQLRRQVAIKIMPRMQSRTSTKRFEREMELTASLNHSYIAKVYDFIADDNFLGIVMEYIPGVPLNKYLQEHNLSLAHKVELFADICSALLYAHENNIIHRDLKPANILVTTEGKPKVIDFGLARRMGASFDLTKSHDILGTPRYMAPEQVVGKSINIDHQSDIYTLGALLSKVMPTPLICILNLPTFRK